MVAFSAWCEDSILRLRWEPGTRITYQDGVDAALSLSTLSASRPMPLLVDITDVEGVSADARTGMNAYTGYTRVALISTNPFADAVSAFSRHAITPVRYFTSEATALQWLTRTA